MDFTTLMPFALFGGIAAIAWLVLERFTAGKPTTDRRLDEIRDPRLRRRNEESAVKKEDGISKMLGKAAPSLAKPLQPKNEKEVTKLKDRLSFAGFRSETAPTTFLGIKFACLIVGLVIGGGVLLLATGFNLSGIFKAAAVGGFFFYLPDIGLAFLGKRRKDGIFYGLPDALDLMVVCVEAGLGLDQAMRRVADEMKKSFVVISEEFGLCNVQLQMGRPRAEVLHDLGQRTGVDDLRALASILIQADKFGSSVAQALRVQSESMRTRRKQMAEEKAAKTAVKLIFPLVLFIFPGIFVVLVGPAAITMVREMFPAMNGGGG